MRILQKKLYNWKDIESNMDNIRETILDKYRDELVKEPSWNSVIMHNREIRMGKLGYYDIEIYYDNILGLEEDVVTIYCRLELNKEVLNRLGIEVDFIRAYLISQHIKIFVGSDGEYLAKPFLSVNYDIRFVGNIEIDNWLEETTLKIRDAVREESTSIVEEISKSLTNYHDYLTSDKAIIEYFKVNNMELYKNGEVYEDEQNKPIRSTESLEELCD